jgi:hypothetical protein
MIEVSHSTRSTTTRKNLENPCKTRIRQIRARKIPFFSVTPQGARQIFPNFSLAVLGDFNELQSKKFGKTFLRSFQPPIVVWPAPTAFALATQKVL